MKHMDAIDELLTRGVDKIYPSKEALEKVLRSGVELRLYQGFDPSGIQLHIGHMTGLMKLRQLQNLGHHVIFLIGDGTGQAGDPSGKTRSRDKYLTREELRQNSKDYVMQASKIIHFTGSNKAEILYNSDWLNKLGLVDILNIAQHFTFGQMKERDLYQERERQGVDINLREFFYPLLQGYDSVAMNVDLELGGTDQTFNMLAGRKLVREILHKEKFVMATPLLTDAEGKKIGKTEGNAIALTAPPNDLYGRIMSLPDDVIDKSFEYITDLSMEEVIKIRQELKSGENPMIYKKKLAFTITKMLNREEEAVKAQKEFERIFQKRENPDEIPEIILKSGALSAVDLLKNYNLAASRAQAKRLVEQGAVEVGKRKITDPGEILRLKSGIIMKVGKRKFIKIVIL